jgi:plasmid stabilization system protein ParE
MVCVLTGEPWEVSMPDLGAYNENVRFNWTAAAELVRELRSTATVLEGQIGERKRIGAGARKQWEGSNAQQFDGRMSSCIGDARRFVTSLRKAADGLAELAKLARQEQQRREQAREWVAQQQRKDWFERDIVDPREGFLRCGRRAATSAAAGRAAEDSDPRCAVDVAWPVNAGRRRVVVTP